MPISLRKRKSPAAPPAPLKPGADPAHRVMHDLYRRMQAKGRTFACDEVGFEVADDIVQQTFLEIWRVCYAEAEEPEAPTEFLFWRVLRNRCYDWRRTNHEHEYEAIREPESGEVMPLTPYADNRNNPLMVAEGSMLKARVEYLVSTFPPEMRRVMMAALEHDFETRPMAESTGMKHDLVKWHLKEGRKRLRQLLEKDGYPVPTHLKTGRPAGRVS